MQRFKDLVVEFQAAAPARKIAIIGTILGIADEKLGQVLQGVPEPVTAAVRDALVLTRNNASKIVTRCDTKLGTTVPPPPSDDGGTSPP